MGYITEADIIDVPPASRKRGRILSPDEIVDINTYVNNQLQPSHGETPPASTVPYNEGLPKKVARGALKVAGGVGAGVLATPETFGAGTIPAAMVGYSVGKKAGDVLFGEEPPPEAPAPRQATSMLGSMAEGFQRLPESLPRTAEGLMTFPAQASESITTPAAQGDIAGVGRAALNIPKGIAEFMAKPTGLMGLEAAKDAWAQDFAGSAMGVAGVAKAGAVAPKLAARAARSGAVRAANRYAEANPDAVEMAKLSAEHDVPLDVGAMVNSPNWKSAATALEKIPVVGTRAFRANQGGRARAAAERIVDDFTPTGGAPEDPGMAVAQSFNRSYQEAKAGVKSAFDVVEQLATSKTTSSPGTAANEFTTEWGPAEGTVSAPSPGVKIAPKNFRAVVEQLQDPEAPYSLPKDFMGDPAVKYLMDPGSGSKNITFAAARNMRTKLNSLYGKYLKQVGTGLIDEREYAGVSKALSAFRDDMREGVMKSDPELLAAYDSAMKQHAENVAPYREAGLKDVIERGGQAKIDSDILLSRFFKPGRPNLARRFWNQLDDQGRQTVQYAILKNAFDAGLDTKSGEAFSPARFAQEMERLGSTRDVIFTPNERAQLDGFTKLMRAAERAGQYGENPPTGQRVIPYAIGGAGVGALLGHPGPLVAGGGAAWLLSRLLTSQVGRNLLLEASRFPETSPALGRTMGKVGVLINKELENAPKGITKAYRGNGD